MRKITALPPETLGSSLSRARLLTGALSISCLGASPKPIRHRPYVRAVSPKPLATGLAFVTCTGSNTIAVIDLASTRVVRQIALDGVPSRIVYDGNRRRVYVALFAANVVAAHDVATGRIVGAFKTGEGPGAMALSDDASRLYVANTIAGTVSAIDLDGGRTVGTAIVGAHPDDIVFDSRTKRLVLVNGGSGTLSLVATNDDRLVATTLRVDPSATALAASADGSTAYVANGNAGTISVVDLGVRRVVATVDGLRQPRSLTIAGERLIVAEAKSASLAVIDIRTAAILERIPVGREPLAVRANVSSDRLFCVSYESGSFAIVDATHARATRFTDRLAKPRDVAIAIAT